MLIKMTSNSSSVEEDKIHNNNATLLRLPREIRDMIHHHILRKEKTVFALKLFSSDDEIRWDQE